MLPRFIFSPQTRSLLLALVACAFVHPVGAQTTLSTPKFSTAGFHELPGSGRTVFDFNPGWRFLKSDAPGAESPAFDDASWEVVNAPHGLELLPMNASGGLNYRGPAWYRKHFRLPDTLAGRRVLVHFEAVMGKSQVWLDGRHVGENFLGGYLPVVIDLGPADALLGRDLVLAVRADNSDDPTFLPGRPQDALDFSYFGGLYRDVWLVAHGPVHLTDPQLAHVVAGGGVFARTTSLAPDHASAELTVDSHLANTTATAQSVIIRQTLVDPATGAVAASADTPLTLAAGAYASVRQTLVAPRPRLWSPDTPVLYRLDTRVLASTADDAPVLDGFSTRIGLRTVEFRGAEGFFLNGRPFKGPLIGTNRHQDFAHIGNALSNSLHWADALKLRAAGLRAIRGHYAQDPAFMDACDELGLFVIPSQTGWQFWNKDPIFGERAIASLRALVRADRNRASILFWEPILNETHYPLSYADAARETIHAEYPVPGCAVACDAGSAGADAYDIIYSPPMPGGSLTYNGWDGKRVTKRYTDYRQPLFTREWGDNVDDWNSQNSPSRCDRALGEAAQLVQAMHYGQPPYTFLSLTRFYLVPPQHIGGTFWHSFDHQRGCHNEPFLGGIMDAFRQPKTSYWMFQSQRDPALRLPGVDSGPMLHIAHEITPFSPPDITLFTNCDEVRLSVLGQSPLVWKRDPAAPGLPHPPVVFKNAYNYMDLKALHRGKKFEQANFTAEGLIDGQVVVTATKFPGKRSDKISLSLDTSGQALIADGSDLAVVVATVTDADGNIRRLAREEIAFTVEGEAILVGDAAIGANPRRVEWGTAPLLIRGTRQPGEIRVTARLVRAVGGRAKPATFTFSSVPAVRPALFRDLPRAATSGAPASALNKSGATTAELTRLREALARAENELTELRRREMERDQALFETPALRKPAR
jgi:beta-galactosidase